MKNRLDKLLVDLGLVHTRSQAKDLILRKQVSVNGEVVLKPSVLFSADDDIKLLAEKLYVSRGALKLKSVLDLLPIDITNKVAIDLGASTGGFTELLLELGCHKVYAIDVGVNQLHASLLSNPQVISMESTNIKDVTILPDKIDLCVGDLSFISLTHIMESAFKLLRPEAEALLLFKPQFEVGKGMLPKDGVIKNKKLLEQSLTNFWEFCKKHHFPLQRVLPSQVSGKTGNQEYFVYFKLDQDIQELDLSDIF
jgi:23S rRNA (cytidine1920-2'-O)/16S rRNA (cytidine1409-2'-O)-methyltransferase